MLRHIWMTIRGYKHVLNAGIRRDGITLNLKGLAWVKYRKGKTIVIMEGE